jgi:transcriptional regulatory protein LEU3
MSVIFDCFWWWRAEFGGQSNPYQDQGESREINDALHGRIGTPPMSMPAFSGADMTLPFMDGDDSLFPDWQWAAGLTFPIDNQMSSDLINVPNSG